MLLGDVLPDAYACMQEILRGRHLCKQVYMNKLCTAWRYMLCVLMHEVCEAGERGLELRIQMVRLMSRVHFGRRVFLGRVQVGAQIQPIVRNSIQLYQSVKALHK